MTSGDPPGVGVTSPLVLSFVNDERVGQEARRESFVDSPLDVGQGARHATKEQSI